MKTLKKTLCLVLAVVMAVGVLVLPAYAADPNYDPAVKALGIYGILHGYDDGEIHKEGSITRAEMAAIVYRVMTGDTSGDNKAAATRYGSAAAKFTDAGTAEWAKGYIGFCANEGVLKGTPGGKVFPNEPITGYEVQAMLLRALGYGKNNEYTGPDWTKYVLADATQLGISKNVPEDPSKVASRGAVAQLTYDAATQTDRVEPALYPTVGYNSIEEPLMLEGTPVDGTDKFGAPSITYSATFTWPKYDKVVSKEVNVEPLAVYWSPVAQSTVGTAAGLKKVTTMTYYVNGVKVTGGKKIDPGNSKLADAVGAQGRYTAVYADRIVCKDVVLGKITNVDAGLVVNGYTVNDPSYTATVYYGTDSAAYSVDVTDKSTSMKKDDVFYAFCLADKDKTSTGELNVAAAIKELRDPKAINPTSVTVSAIVYNEDDEVTGLVAGNKTYLYNNTFGGNFGVEDATDAYTKLKDADIGDKWFVYTDSQGNILGLEPDIEAVAGSVGVGLDTEAYRIKSGEYAAELVLLNAKGGKDTVRFLDDSTHKPFASEAEAIAAADKYVDMLVSYEYDYDAVDNGYTGYYVVDTTDVTTVNSGLEKIDSGDADAITGTSNLLNDDTVFFLANYKYSSKVGGYVFSNYSVITGFQNIKDLTFNSSDKISGGADPVDSLEAQIISDGDWAKYVLVLNATEQASNKKVSVPNYAFIVDSNKFLKAYDDYLAYSAIVNGKANTELRFDFKTQDIIDETGLYEYGDRDKNTSIWGEIGKSKNTFDGGNYGYKAGVLYDNTEAKSASNFYAVVPNVAIYVVNPETGTSTKLDYKLSDVVRAYGTENMWYQLNEYEWINLIYFIGDKVPSVGAPDEPVNSISKVTFTGVKDKSLISSAKVTAETSDNVKAETSLKWEVWDDTTRTWNSVAANECFASTLTYRVTITFTAASNYAMNLTPKTTTIGDVSGVTADDQLCTSADSIRVEFTVA